MSTATIKPSVKRSQLKGFGSLITFKRKNQCLGFLFEFTGHGVYDAEYGMVDVDPKDVGKHNDALSTAQIEGLKSCKIGQGGTFYYRGCVRTFTGQIVADEVSTHRVSKTVLEFRFHKMLFRGKLSAGIERFVFKRVE